VDLNAVCVINQGKGQKMKKQKSKERNWRHTTSING